MKVQTFAAAAALLVPGVLSAKSKLRGVILAADYENQPNQYDSEDKDRFEFEGFEDFDTELDDEEEEEYVEEFDSSEDFKTENYLKYGYGGYGGYSGPYGPRNPTPHYYGGGGGGGGGSPGGESLTLTAV